MKIQTDKTQESQKGTIQRVEQEPSIGGEATIADNRPAIAVQRKLRSAIGGAEDTNNPIQRKNNTGLPDNLKSGIENLSGYSMGDVKVHYNSSKPAQLQAHAYAQGTDIHLAPGQEKHLPHEAWHVVQQKQGRVKPTKQLKSKVNINDDVGLEKEADVMGKKAQILQPKIKTFSTPYQRNLKVVSEKINLADTVQRKLQRPTISVNFAATIATNMTRANQTQIKTTNATLAENLTAVDLEDMYRNAIRYIESKPTGKIILDKIKDWNNNVRVIIGDDHRTVTTITNPDITIHWNPLMSLGVWSEGRLGLAEQAGIMSPAAVLLHEFGHALQYIDDPTGYNKWPAAQQPNTLLNMNTFEGGEAFKRMEHHNMYKAEYPFNKEAGEPLRDKYKNARAENDIEFNPAAPPVPPEISAAFDERAVYINQHGWKEAVTYHSRGTDLKNHDIINAKHFGFKKIGKLLKNEYVWLDTMKSFVKTEVQEVLDAGGQHAGGNALNALLRLFRIWQADGPKTISRATRDILDTLLFGIWPRLTTEGQNINRVRGRYIILTRPSNIRN
ncbi:DUF4157 domain-containing protein [uncultured Aquimarina sp.]|uniref:eCIS core domain-containing protein n=1 Tax=uncultured Aquimarina sp. TaxID=575652 RepID=UPI002627C88C|nr:DUF4157 domain-containing protein [uncultured Aquimarina sp.]